MATFLSHKGCFTAKNMTSNKGYFLTIKKANLLKGSKSLNAYAPNNRATKIQKKKKKHKLLDMQGPSQKFTV